jgi:hypothetical protein
VWTAHSEKETNFSDGRYKKLYFGTYFSRGRRKKTSTELRANTYPKKGILKSGWSCAFCVKLHSPQRTEDKPAPGLCTSSTWPLYIPLSTTNHATTFLIPKTTQDVIPVLEVPSKITPKKIWTIFLAVPTGLCGMHRYQEIPRVSSYSV